MAEQRYTHYVRSKPHRVMKETATENKAPAAPSPNEAHALDAGLRYAHPADPGITRQGCKADGFTYRHPSGKPVRDAATLERIRKLAIPPGYTDVWICPDPQGHLQATGRDARGRLQYRYHLNWRQVRDEDKFSRMLAFAKALPDLRAQLEADLKPPGLPKEKVLATVILLLQRTYIRIGNDAYEKENKSYGLTTLKDKHAFIEGRQIKLSFKGKSGVRHSITLSDARLARIIKKCQDLPGQQLFQYLGPDGSLAAIGSADVNQYLKQAMSGPFTAKDFRTWAGTLLCCQYLDSLARLAEGPLTQKHVADTIKQVAACLGNTPAVCKKSYIHPAVFTAYQGGGHKPDVMLIANVDMPGLTPEEARLVAWLEGLAALNG